MEGTAHSRARYTCLETEKLKAEEIIFRPSRCRMFPLRAGLCFLSQRPHCSFGATEITSFHAGGGRTAAAKSVLPRRQLDGSSLQDRALAFQALCAPAGNPRLSQQPGMFFASLQHFCVQKSLKHVDLDGETLLAPILQVWKRRIPAAGVLLVRRAAGRQTPQLYIPPRS